MVIHFLTPLKYTKKKKKKSSFFVLSVPELIFHKSFIPLISKKEKERYLSLSGKLSLMQ